MAAQTRPCERARDERLRRANVTDGHARRAVASGAAAPPLRRRARLDAPRRDDDAARSRASRARPVRAADGDSTKDGNAFESADDWIANWKAGNFPRAKGWKFGDPSSEGAGTCSRRRWRRVRRGGGGGGRGDGPLRPVRRRPQRQRLRVLP